MTLRLQIPITLHKECDGDVMRCGFKIGGGIDQDFHKSPQGYTDNVSVVRDGPTTFALILPFFFRGYTSRRCTIKVPPRKAVSGSTIRFYSVTDTTLRWFVTFSTQRSRKTNRWIPFSVITDVYFCVFMNIIAVARFDPTRCENCT